MKNELSLCVLSAFSVLSYVWVSKDTKAKEKHPSPKFRQVGRGKWTDASVFPRRAGLA